MSEQLARFLAREYDRQAAQVEPDTAHIEDAVWALLADGLIAPSARDALLEHASTCTPCRQRLALITRELPDAMTLADGRASALLAASATPLILRLRRASVYAAAAVVLLAVGAGLYFGLGRPSEPAGYHLDAAGWLSPEAGLTDLGVDLRRRVTRDDARPAIGEAAYRDALAKLAGPLGRSQPPSDALALATRAALSARFFEDAAEHARRWAAASPDDPAAANALGLALYQVGQFEDALAAFERAIALAPQTAEFHLNAALAAAEAGRPAEPIREHLRAFQRLAPADARLPEVLAWNRRLNGSGP